MSNVLFFMLKIKTQDTIFETEFIHAQINITSRCNMKCEHCRGAYEGATDLSIDDFENVIKFCYRNIAKGAGFLISGGEPFLHPQFKKILKLLKKYSRKDEFVSITTNGSFITKEWLDFLQNLKLPNFRISISLDSINPERYNLFRHCPYAFEKAIKAIKMVSERQSIKCIVRSTIQKDQLNEIEEMANLVESLGANTLSIASIIPVGRAINKTDFYFDKNSKHKLIKLSDKLKKNHPKLEFEINDPLYYMNYCSIGGCGEYGGCIAGIGSFSVEPNGNLLPCPFLPNQIITNTLQKTPTQIMHNYVRSNIIHSLLNRDLSGKCGKCKYRFICGGCRARAEGFYGNYLAEDPDCWL